MLNLETRRAARLLLLATRVAKSRDLSRVSEGPLHKIADSHQAKLSVAIRYAFASARAAMRPRLQSKEDVSYATSVGIVKLREALREVLPKTLRKIYVEGGELAAENLLRTAEFNEAEHPRDEDGRFTIGNIGVHVDKRVTAEQHAAFKASLSKLPKDLFHPQIGALRSGNIQLVSNIKEFGHSHAGGDILGIREGNSIIVQAGDDQENTLFHEIGHIDFNHMANRKEIVSAFEADTKKTAKGQLRYYKSDIKEALAQSYAYHLGARNSDHAAFVKYFSKLHEAVGNTRTFKKIKGLEEFRAAKKEPTKRFSFDSKQQEAIDWADRYAAELITQISETSREDINNAVSEFLETGDFNELRNEILAAVGDTKRADLIARNEPMRAVHEGQREAWRQAVDEGLLPEDAVREWIVVGDEKVCPICERLEGKTASLDGEYPGGFEGPPAHVSCRCSESITARRALGDFEGHPFRGNQWTAGSALRDSLTDPGKMSFEEFSSVPKLPPVPEGHVRLVHVTDDKNIDSILEHGLQRSKSRGANYGEPSVVWATSLSERWGGSLSEKSRAIIFDMPQSEVSMAGTLARLGDVPADKIVAVDRAGYSDVSTGALTLREERQIEDPDERRLYWEAYRERRALGGRGSGNYGHSGRIGEVGGSGTGGVRSERSARALKHFKPIHAEAQRHAENNELAIRKLVGGERTDDNLPVDVITKIENEVHGIEVKTMINNSNDKITMRKAAVEKKEAWARKNKAKTHTVVIDDRGKLGNKGYSGHRIYYAEGHGSFRLTSMTRVESAAHLRQLIAEGK